MRLREPSRSRSYARRCCRAALLPSGAAEPFEVARSVKWQRPAGGTERYFAGSPLVISPDETKALVALSDDSTPEWKYVQLEVNLATGAVRQIEDFGAREGLWLDEWRWLTGAMPPDAVDESLYLIDGSGLDLEYTLVVRNVVPGRVLGRAGEDDLVMANLPGPESDEPAYAFIAISAIEEAADGLRPAIDVFEDPDVQLVPVQERWELSAHPVIPRSQGSCRLS
jgi:hypothetical protein